MYFPNNRRVYNKQQRPPPLEKNSSTNFCFYSVITTLFPANQSSRCTTGFNTNRCCIESLKVLFFVSLINSDDPQRSSLASSASRSAIFIAQCESWRLGSLSAIFASTPQFWFRPPPRAKVSRFLWTLELSFTRRTMKDALLMLMLASMVCYLCSLTPL